MKKVLLSLIRLYMNIKRRYFPSTLGCCKYYPCCSKYSYEAVTKYGALKGTALAMWRVARCNPFSKGGYDPLK